MPQKPPMFSGGRKPISGVPGGAVDSIRQTVTRGAFVAALFLTASGPLEAALASVGGGLLDSGLQGEYFDNTTLSGSPAFTRKDVRVDFDWGTKLPIGGSTAPGFADFPTNNFSVRWTGQLMPRFSETYTITLDADDGVRLWIAPEGQSFGNPLIDEWTYTGALHSATIALNANQRYDIKIEYREDYADAKCRLLWSSPSTPEEVIQPASISAINGFLTYHDTWVADNFRLFQPWSHDLPNFKYAGNNNYLSSGDLDNNGWPKVDFKHRIDAFVDGTFLLRFKGKAEVDFNWSQVDIQAGGQSYTEILPKGAGYDSASNITEALVTIPWPQERWDISFNNTERLDGSGENGVFDVVFMRPIAKGSNTPHHPDEVATRGFRESTSHYVAIRAINMGLGCPIRTWSDRSLPGNALDKTRMNPPLENLIMACNEAGRDLYLCVPHLADDAYFNKLAKLMRYGSDGVEPYSDFTSNPKYPPLNANLCVYLEFSNEVWNYHPNEMAAESYELINSGDPIGNALNYDGAFTDSNGDGDVDKVDWYTGMARLWGYKTLRMSRAFIDVYGHDDFGARFRPLVMWQYDNVWGAAEIFRIMDDYFANGNGNANVPNSLWPYDPKPVNYYLWGGSGAAYYKGANDLGVQDNEPLPNFNFESPNVASGTDQQQPSGASWSFSGTAGIRDFGSDIVDNASGYEPIDLGTQAAYIQGTGSMEATFSVGQADTYWLAFRAKDPGTSSNPELENMIQIEIDGQVLPMNDATGRFWTSRNGSKPRHEFCAYSSGVFQLSAGSHTIKIIGLGLPAKSDDPVGTYPNARLYLDGIHLGSQTAFFGPNNENFPTRGSAAGSTKGEWTFAQWREAHYARSWGLNPAGYEGGWSLGGDYYQYWLNHFKDLKYSVAQTADANTRVIQMASEYGQTLHTFGTYSQWPEEVSPELGSQYPLVQSVIEMNRSLPAEANSGESLPATLNAGNSYFDCNWGPNKTDNYDRNTGQLTAPDGWVAWAIIVPATGDYEVSGSFTGSGELVAMANLDTPIFTVTSAGTHSGTVYLTKGQHSIRLDVTSGSITHGDLTIAAVAPPSDGGSGDSSDDFESGDLSGGNGWADASWADVGNKPATVQSAVVPSAGSGNSVELIHKGAIERGFAPLSTSTDLTFAYRINSFESADLAIVDAFDGSTWSTVWSMQGQNGDGTATVSLPAGTSALRFRVDCNWETDYFYVDNIVVGTATGGGSGSVGSWLENFDLSNGTDSDTGDTAWSVDTSGITGNLPTFSVQNGGFEASDTGGEAVWFSETIYVDGSADISVDIQSGGTDAMEAADTLTVAYIADGGAETAIASRSGNFNGDAPETVSVSGISASTIQVVIRAKVSYEQEQYRWDNVQVTGASGDSGGWDGYIEAENYDNASNFVPFEIQSDGDASGGQFIVWPNDGTNRNNGTADDSDTGQAHYQFSLGQSEDVTVWVRVNFAGGVDDSFHYKLDGHSGWQTQNGWSTGGQWQWKELATFTNVTAGDYTFRLLRREDGSKIDRLYFATDGSTPQ
ncbi:MAG: PA14 domain-containing protein [Opitutales bacterium]